MIQLIRPKIELFSSYMHFISEMHEQGEKIWEEIVQKGEESPELFVGRLLQASNPITDRVPETTYWATIKNEVVGRISVRHKLNENLSEFGGHIGYEVRPSYRRKGVAKEMLKNLLATPKAKEIGLLLLTCSPDNIASNKTITANGGILIETRFVKKWNRDTNYYWINLNT